MEDERVCREPTSEWPARYEPPQVERILTPADLEHEIVHGGGSLPSGVS